MVATLLFALGPAAELRQPRLSYYAVKIRRKLESGLAVKVVSITVGVLDTEEGRGPHPSAGSSAGRSKKFAIADASELECTLVRLSVLQFIKEVNDKIVISIINDPRENKHQDCKLGIFLPRR